MIANSRPSLPTLLRQPLDDVLPRRRLSQAHGGDFHVFGRVAPRLGLLDAVEHTDDDASLGRVALEADRTAAAGQVAPSEWRGRGRSMGRIVALEHLLVAGDVYLGHD